ncbi:TolC family protein [Tellurirhabdus rosea]|uniref:TolC family protein n=1 Tax=Tellurirhabdus rosea TaxID=2674997 RepID=UPI0022549887|nr:TolC family protein [Tellurirhabdus rosea]
MIESHRTFRINRIAALSLAAGLLTVPAVQAQRLLSLPEAINMALENNPQVKVANLRVDKQRALLPSALSLTGPELIFEAPTTRHFEPGLLMPFSLPTVYRNQRKVQEQQVQLSQTEKQVTTNTLRYNVRTIFNEILYLRESIANYRRQDSLLLDFARVTGVRQRVGQISRIEVLNAQSQQREIRYLLDQTRARVRSARIQLGLLVGMPNDTTLQAAGTFGKLAYSTPFLSSDSTFTRNPLSGFYRQNQRLSEANLTLEQKRRLPNIIVGYLNQGTAESPWLYRFRFGMSLPVWGWVASSRIKAAQTDVAIARTQISLNQYELQGSYDKAFADYLQYQEALDYFETIGLLEANEIVKAAQDGYRLGSIGYYDYLLNIQQAFKIRLGYLEALRNFNQAVITLQYLKGE